MDRVKSEDAIGAKGRPFTGAEYLESLRDGREVYIYGERVKDVTTHPAFRNAARSIARLYDALHDREDQGRADLADRHRLRRLHPQILPRRALARGSGGAARRHRRWARMSYGWMGRSPDYKASLMNTLGANHRVLRQVRRQREGLVPARAGERAVHEPRHRQSAGRPRQGGRPGEGRVHHHPEGDRRRHLRLRRQGGGDLVGAHALQFPRPERRGAAARHRSRGDVHRADERAGREAVLPHLLRDDGERDGHAVRLSAVVALRRERRHLRVRQCVHPLGGRAAPPRPREAQDLLPAVGLPGRLSVPGLHAACGQARLPGRRHRQGAARDRRRRVPRQSGDARRDHRLAQPVLGADRRHGGQSDAVGRRRGAAERAVGLELSRVRRRRLWPRQGDRREDHRLGADLSAVVGQGFRESGDRPVSRAICARLARHRLQGAHQGDEAAVGRDRHRIRRPPRALRDELRRQPRGHPHPGDVECARAPARSTDDRARRAVPVRLRRERLDRSGLDRSGRCRLSGRAARQRAAE